MVRVRAQVRKAPKQTANGAVSHPCRSNVVDIRAGYILVILLPTAYRAASSSGFQDLIQIQAHREES